MVAATAKVRDGAVAEPETDNLDCRVGLLDRPGRVYDRWAMNTAVNRLAGERADHAFALLRVNRPSEPDTTTQA